MQINEPDARKIETALSELLTNRQHIDLHEDDRAMLQEALGIILKVTANRAPGALIEEARNLDAVRRMGDDCEIDDDAGMSDADGGTWVQAWVWVPVAETECGQCEGTGTTDAMGHDEECPVCDGTGQLADTTA